MTVTLQGKPTRGSLDAGRAKLRLSRGFPPCPCLTRSPPKEVDGVPTGVWYSMSAPS
jgi:hypothetical protein